MVNRFSIYNKIKHISVYPPKKFQNLKATKQGYQNI